MNTKMKMRMLSLLLCFVMLVGLMPTTAFAWTAPTLSGGDAAWNVQLSDEGVLTWNDMGSATYDIYVDEFGSGGTVTKIQGISGTSYNLINRFKELKIDNDTYYFNIKANDTDTYSGYISFKYVSPEAKLSEPQNLRWDGTVAKWDSVANATEYEVKIYSNKGYLRYTITTTETQYDWTTEAEAGRWFEVVATGDNYRNSNVAEGPKYGSYSWSAPTLSGGDAAWNVQLSDEGVLTWNDMGSATYDIYVDEFGSGGTVTKIQGISGTSYNLINRFKELKIDNDTYYFNIKANDTDTYSGYISFKYVSPEAKLSEPQNLRWDGTVAKWDSVANATEYEVKIYSNKGYLRYTITTTETQYDWTTEAEAGRWFEVVATGDNYRNSNAAESPLYGSSVATSYHVGADVYNITTNEQYTGGKVKIVTPDDTGDYAYVGYGYDVDANAEVTMYAQADTGYEFVEWRTGSESGTQYSTNATVTFNATEDKVLYAIFQQTVSLTQISELSATVTAPVGGEHPSFTVTVPDGAHYTAVVDTWYDLNNNGAHLTNSDTFVTDNEYQVRIHFTANTGYEIANGASYTINGTPNSTTFNTVEQRGMIFVATAPATQQISELSATVTAPVGGEHPSFTVTVPDGAHYTAVVDTWYDLNNNGAHLTNSDTFVTDNEYQVRIHFTANTGYEIANGASYTINGTPNSTTFNTVEQRGMIFVATAPAVTTYTVTYDANGGTGSMADATGVSGEYTLLANGFTAPDGKQFKAWSVGGEEKAVGDKITVTANTTVTAIWEAVEYNVTVTGGTASVGAGAPITKATMGTTVTLTAGAAPTGQMFDKWVVNGVVVDDANSATTTFLMPAGNVTATATYKDIPVVTYTVTFDSAGGSAVTAQTIEAGQKATKPADPTKSGYDFKGWTLNGSAYDFNTAVNGDITLVATWEQQQIVPTVYTVTFDSNGGSAVTAQTIEAGQKATKPADPTKSGYDFKGWTLNGSAYDFNTAVNGDITLVATWETIPAGHTCDIKPVAKVEPSCTEGGKEAYYKCEGCGKFYEDALGAKEITDLAAWGNIAKNGHTESDWKSDKDNHWKECTVAACGVIIENSKAAHADANNDGKCDTCEYNVGTTTTNPNNKPNDNPQTGDNSNMFLWIALLFVSGFGVVATTVIGKKKSSAK